MSEPDSTATRRRFLVSAAGAGVGVLAAGGAYLALRGGSASPAPHPKEVDVTAEPNPRLFTFVGGTAGPWSVVSVTAVTGESLPVVSRLDIVNGPAAEAPGAAWALRGVTSNERYATRAEKTELAAKQAALGRPAATHAALIPIRKSAAWWALTQDERRAIFEEQSGHTRTGLRYLPAVARRLHHCRDLGEKEPFDFLTLFDYAPADAPAFEQMVAELRASAEWKYVDREIDIRLVRAG
jgi:hypothetical protein